MPCSRPTDTASWEGDRVNVFDYAEREAYLTNSKMAEAADKLCLVERRRSFPFDAWSVFSVLGIIDYP